MSFFVFEFKIFYLHHFTKTKILTTILICLFQKLHFQDKIFQIEYIQTKDRIPQNWIINQFIQLLSLQLDFMQSQNKTLNFPQNISAFKNYTVSPQQMSFSPQNSKENENHEEVTFFLNKNNSFESHLTEQRMKINLTIEDLQYFGCGIKKKQWTEKQDKILMICAQKYDCDWEKVVEKLPDRNKKMCYSRYQRIKLETKIPWKIQQNRQIKRLYQKQNLTWRQISFYFPNRTCKQIRQHYIGYLKAQTNCNDWTIEQDTKLIQLYNQFGTKWKKMEGYFSKRNQNQIKNRFYGRILKLQQKKRLNEQKSSIKMKFQ